jgi:putative toxin-antitoxin system antitoxin component (TIGR02293 family)
MPSLEDVADLLGLAAVGHGGSRFRLISMIEGGLPLAALDRLSHLLAPADNAFKYRIVPKASLARRKHGKRLSADESGRLARLARIWSFAREVWGGEDEARDFLFRPHPLLEDRPPIELALASEMGAQLVTDIIGRLQYGSAV